MLAGWGEPQLNWLGGYSPTKAQIGGAHQKRKGGQIRFTNEQTDSLEHMFDTQKYLNNVQRRKLAKSLDLSERQVSRDAADRNWGRNASLFKVKTW